VEGEHKNSKINQMFESVGKISDKDTDQSAAHLSTGKAEILEALHNHLLRLARRKRPRYAEQWHNNSTVTK